MSKNKLTHAQENLIRLIKNTGALYCDNSTTGKGKCYCISYGKNINIRRATAAVLLDHKIIEADNKEDFITVYTLTAGNEL